MPWQTLTRSWLRLDTSSISLAVKWSLSIGLLICVGMGLLGWFLINQQAESFRLQTTSLGRTIVNQMAYAASEPLMADDKFTLQNLVRREIDDVLILGVAIFDAEGELQAQAGDMHVPSGGVTTMGLPPVTHFQSPIRFKDVTAGQASMLLDTRPLQASQLTLFKTLVSTSVALILGTVLLAFPLARRFAEPIYQLMHVGEAWDRGKPASLPPGERQDEIGRVMSVFQSLSEGIAEKQQVEQTLYRHVSRVVANKLLSSPAAAQLGGEDTVGSVLFCDIVGFTSVAENLPPTSIAELLNQYYGHFALAASSCGGTVDKYIGDCVMILFGIPQADTNHGLHAVTCALLIQSIVERINHQRWQRGDIALQFRIGINSGEMLAGNLGNVERMQFTVVGDAVNLASRLCSMSPPGGILLADQTLMQPGVAEQVRTQAMQPVQVRGRSQATICHQLKGLSAPHMDELRRVLDNILPEGSGPIQ